MTFTTVSAELTVRRGAAPVAGAALAGWSWLFLDTDYLEPLPWRAGSIGVVGFLVVVFGAGLVGGLRLRTLMLLVPLLVGFVGIAAKWDAGTLVRAFGESEQETNAVLGLLWLAPLFLLAGAVIARFSRYAQASGLALLVLPLAFVAWAGFRHLRPLDGHPSHPLLIDAQAVTYRGVSVGERQERVVASLGDFGQDDYDFVQGRVEDIDIRNARAETAEGVGIGDSLGLVQRRYPERFGCGYEGADFQWEPICGTHVGQPHQLTFIGDPITEILITP